MKLSDIVTEQQLDELDVAGGLARGLGAVAKGAGAVAGAGVGAIDAVKSGFSAGRAAVGGYKAPAPEDDGVKGTLNTKELANILPGVDAAALAKAVAVVKAGGEPSMSQQKILSNAFIAMLKADPAATTKAATLLKRVSGEAPAAPAAQAQAAPAAQAQAAPAAQAQAAQSPAAAQAKPNPATVAAQTRTGKQAVAAKAAQDQMAANPAATKTAPQTPDQIRTGKQAAAGTTARAQMAANPAAPKPAAPQTPDQIRAAKQAAAGKTAQDQMAANPAAPKAAPPQTPDQIRAGKQAVAGKTAQDQMAANPDKLGRIEPTMDPASGAPIKPGATTPTSGRPQGGGKVAGKLSDNPRAVMRRDQRQANASAPGAAAFGNMSSQLGKGNEKNYQATLDKNIAAQKTAADPAAVPGATTTTPGGEKVLANPVATVGTKRATNIGKQTFDTQTGKSLPGQALNNVRKKAEYGSNALGAVRKKIKAGAADGAALAKKATGTESVDYSIRESRSIFTK